MSFISRGSSLRRSGDRTRSNDGFARGTDTAGTANAAPSRGVNVTAPAGDVDFKNPGPGA